MNLLKNQNLLLAVIVTLVGQISALAQTSAKLPNPTPDFHQDSKFSIVRSLQIAPTKKQDPQIEKMRMELGQLREELSAEKAKNVGLDRLIKSGGGVDGGGFLYTETSSEHLKNVVYVINRIMPNIPEQVLKGIEEHFNAQIDWNEFRKIVSRIISSPLANNFRPNDQGQMSPLIMDYDKANRTITALEPFFKKYDKRGLSREDEEEIIRLVLHEASHLFGVGINRNDAESAQFSRFLSGEIYKYARHCGGSGTFEDRQSNCLTGYSGINSNWHKIYSAFNIIGTMTGYDKDNGQRSSNLAPYISIVRDANSHKMITSTISVAREKSWKFNFCGALPEPIKSWGNWRLPTKEEAQRLVTDGDELKDHVLNYMFSEDTKDHPDRQCLLTNSSDMQSVCYDRKTRSGVSSRFFAVEDFTFVICVAD